MSKIVLTEEAGVPSTPAAGKWTLYTKAGGLYYLDDAGTEIGPLNAGTTLTKAAASDVATGTDDAKYVTSLGIKNSVNVPNVAPSTSGNVLTSNGTAWTSAAASGGADWVADTGTWSYSSADSPTGVISINADKTDKIQKGMRLKFDQPQALTAYFPMDTNSTSTVGSFTSTDVATPTYTAGKFSNALTLNGTTQCVQITDTALMKPTGEFTIGLWYKSGATGATQSLFQSYSDNTNANGIRLEITAANVLTFGIGNNSASDSSTLTGTAVVANGTYHYIVVSSRNNYTQIYVDGILDVAGYTVTPTYATNYVQMGVRNVAGANVAGTWLNGQIDDLYLINGYALDEETIRAKYLAASAQGASNITVGKKAIVTGIGAWSGSAQLVTVYHGTDHSLTSGAISNPYYSTAKVPFGFNANPNKWTVLFVDILTRTKASATYPTLYYSDFGSLNLNAPIGIWDLIGHAFLDASKLATTGTSMLAYISTSNSSVSDADLQMVAGTASALGGLEAFITGSISKTLTMFVKTPLYVIAQTNDTGSTINFLNATKPLRITLRSAYL